MANGRVARASRVGSKCLVTESRVVEGRGVGSERPCTNCCIAATRSVQEERVSASAGVCLTRHGDVAGANAKKRIVGAEVVEEPLPVLRQIASSGRRLIEVEVTRTNRLSAGKRVVPQTGEAEAHLIRGNAS